MKEEDSREKVNIGSTVQTAEKYVAKGKKKVLLNAWNNGKLWE